MFTCPPFGLAAAPRVFTQILSAMYALPRLLPWPLTAMVDDSARLTVLISTGRWRSLVSAQQEEALGAVHNREKTVFDPVTIGQFLGLLVDMNRGEFIVLEYKSQRFQTEAVQLQETPDPTIRATLLHSLCGQFASFHLALNFSPLPGKVACTCYRGIRQPRRPEHPRTPGHPEHPSTHHPPLPLRPPRDDQFTPFTTRSNPDTPEHPPPCSLPSLLPFLATHLEQLNGKPWHSDLTATTATLVTDASESQCGAALLDHPWRTYIPFTPHEALLMK